MSPKQKSYQLFFNHTFSVQVSISLKVGANVFIYGTIKQAGTKIRLNAQIIDPKTGDALKSFRNRGTHKEEMIFTIIDSLSTMVKNFLIISKMQKHAPPKFQSFASTNSAEAYRLCMYGNEAFSKLDFHSAIELFSRQSLLTQIMFAAINQLSFAYGNLLQYDQGKQWSLKSYRKRDQMSMKRGSVQIGLIPDS